MRVKITKVQYFLIKQKLSKLILLIKKTKDFIKKNSNNPY